MQQGKFTIAGWAGWKTEQTEIWEKEGRAGKRLRRELLKIDFESYGGPYVEQFSFLSKNGVPITIRVLYDMHIMLRPNAQELFHDEKKSAIAVITSEFV